MCGGKGIRMRTRTEKPLLRVGNISMIERVLSALAGSRRFSRIVTVTSPNAPDTKQLMVVRGIEVIETAGNSYPHDLSLALARLRPEKVMVVPADIPLLDSQTVNDIVEIACSKQEPAVSIVLEKQFVESMGIKPSVVVGRYCHSGITVFDTARVAEDAAVQESYIVMNSEKLALNVNTKEELDLAEKLLVQRA